jgi:His-Xaa-Ser system radical SAM maturase HxsB
MATSRIDFEGMQGEEYVISQFRVKKYDEEHILITTDNGAWAVLNKKEYMLFRTNRIGEDKKLFATLKENGIVVTRDNIDQVVEDFRKRYWFMFQGPDLHIMIPTFRCNLRCVYCHSFSKPLDAKGWDMDEATAKAVVDFMFKTTAKDFSIEFQGGDCSFNLDVVKFAMDYARKLAREQQRKVKFSIVTNLTHVDDDFIKFLKDNIPIGLCTSLDGPKEVHDMNRKHLGGSGSHDEVVHWIKRIGEEMKGYDFRFHALTTVTRHSLGYGKEIIDEFRGLGFHSVWLRFMNNLGFAEKTWGKIGYSAEEYLKFWSDALEYVMKINHGGEEFREVWAYLASSVILGKESTSMVDFRSPCGAGIGQLLYNHKGDIFTCDEAKVLDLFKLGNVKKSEYADIFKSPTTTSMVDISSKFASLCDACPWFAYCSLCPVNTFASQGSIVPKLPQDMRCRIFKGMINSIFEKIIFSQKDTSVLKQWSSGGAWRGQ